MPRDWVQVVEDLRQRLAALEAENQKLKAQTEQLENENRRLREQLEQAQTAALRQAAPFRREERRKVPDALKKRPGQKPGHPGHCRQPPDHVDETVELPLLQCPRCGGPICDTERIEQIIEEIRASGAAFVDETSWWVGGPKWWLWVFTTARRTVYHVDEARGSRVVDELLGVDFGGMLVSDCLNSYDPPPCVKHKCIAHHLRAISKALLLPDSEDSAYLRAWQSAPYGRR